MLGKVGHKYLSELFVILTKSKGTDKLKEKLASQFEKEAIIVKERNLDYIAFIIKVC